MNVARPMDESLTNALSHVIYRVATAADLPAMAALLETAGLPAREIEPFVSTFMVAEADGRLVAVGGLEIRDDTAVLRSVAVDDSMRGTGVGRGLARELIDLAARASVADIYLFTGDAHGFWQRMGFAEITLEDWRETARQSWQWKYVSENLEWAQAMGMHTMWMSASA